MSSALAECIWLTRAIYRRRRQHPGAEEEECPWERRCLERIHALYREMTVDEHERATHASQFFFDQWRYGI